MIAPGLLRRSMRKALRWRVLLIWWCSLLVPSAIAAVPAFAFLRERLDHSTRAPGALAWMDGATLIDLVRQVSASGASASLLAGSIGALLALLVTAPFAGGAMVASAGAGEALPFPRLLAGAGGLYGRMVRVALLGLVPLGLGAAAAAGIAKLALRVNERVATETAAERNLALAAAAAGAVLFLAHLLLDAARAQFAAEPARSSAAGAFRSAARLLARRPFRSAGVGALGAAVGLGSAAALMALRLRIAQSGPAAMALAWVLAQAAQTAIGWGKALRIEGLAELWRTDAALRARGESLPPGAPLPGSQAEVVHSATLSALDPPRSGAAR